MKRCLNHKKSAKITNVFVHGNLEPQVRIYVCICMYMYVCTYACMYVCMYVCTYVCLYVCMYVCLCMYACICVCMYMKDYLYVYMHMHNSYILTYIDKINQMFILITGSIYKIALVSMVVHQYLVLINDKLRLKVL